MNSDDARGRHAEHELERAIVAKQRKAERREQEIRDRERRRVCALIAPELTPDWTGFCEGGMV